MATDYNIKIYLDVKQNGFYGVYWENVHSTRKAIILMLGDDADDRLAVSGAKWALKHGLNVLTMSPNKKDYSHVNYPLERIENAINFMKTKGNKFFAIGGASTTAMVALVAASYFKEITLTLAFSPSDFVWQGFQRGKLDGASEWPVEGASTLSYRNENLPFMPFCYQHPKYNEVLKEEAKKSKSLAASRKLFDDSEVAHPISEDEFIKVENINGLLLLVGAKDDTLWDCVRYINRMDERLKTHPHKVDYELATYEIGSHFIFPFSLIKMFLPFGYSLLLKIAFKSIRDNYNETINTLKDIDVRVNKVIAKWIKICESEAYWEEKNRFSKREFS